MARFSGLQAITANRLLSGEVTYFTDTGEWTGDLSQAALYRSAEDAAAALAKAEARAGEDQVLDVYLFDLTEDGGLRPTARREVIRQLGPSVAVDLNTSPLGAGAR